MKGRNQVSIMSRKFGVNFISSVKCLGGHSKDKAGKKAFEFGPYQRADLVGQHRMQTVSMSNKSRESFKKLTDTLKCYFTCYHPILRLGHRRLKEVDLFKAMQPTRA